jgi:hypothetical protein
MLIYIEAESKALASVWMGYSTMRSELTHDRIRLLGDSLLTRTIDKWLVKISFADSTPASEDGVLPIQPAMAQHK